MTLVEVMVALVLLMITMLPLGYLVTSEVHQAATAKDRLAALGVAEKWVEILGSAQDPPPKSGSLAVDTGKPLIPIRPDGTPLPNGTESRGGTVFTVRAEYAWTGTQDAYTPPDLCSSGGAQVLNLQVTVSWGVRQQVTDTTILNYPPPGIPKYGFYQLQFAGATGASDVGLNSWSNRVQAIPVTFTEITPTSYANRPIYPDQYGCVFAELIPGTYTVSVADPAAGTPTGTTYGTPSFVQNLGTDGNPSEPKSLTVPNANPVLIAPGVTTPLTTLYYDEGSTIGLSYPSSTSTADGVTCPGIGQITCVSEGEGTTGSLGWRSTTNPNPPGATLAWTSGSTWSSAVMPSSTRIASVACTTVACIGVGYGLTGTGPQGVIIADNTTTPTPPPSTVPADTVPAVASLSQVVCPTSTACVAWGTLNSGLPVVLAGTISSSSGDTWNEVSLPAAMTTLNQVACTPALNCVAVGSGGGAGLAASGPVYGSSGPPSAGTWVSSTLAGVSGVGVTLSNLTQVACPSTLACMAIGTGQLLVSGVLGPIEPIVISGVPSVAGAGLGSVLTWTPVLYPGLPALPPTALSQLVCPSSTTCLVVGTLTSQALIYSDTAVAGVFIPLLTPDVVPPTTSSLSQVACPSSGVCVAIGSSSTGGPVILSGAIGSPDTWSLPAAVIPAGITLVSAVSCPNTTTCAIAASTTSSTSSVASILSGTPGTSATWSSAPLPSADASTLYLTGISCTPTVEPSTCSAVGASPSGAVIMMSTGGPSGTWNDRTSDSGLTLTGSPTSNIPIELTNHLLINNNPLITGGAWNPVPATTLGTANTTSIPDIFPFANGYGLFAGDCVDEGTAYSAASTVAATVPGNTAPSPGATVPLAVLPIQVNSPVGAPESGDVLTLKAATTLNCTANDSYTLQPTGPDGLSRTEVPFGTYTLTVKLSSGGPSPTYPPVIVSPGAVTVGSTLYPLPQPATVVGP